MVARKREVQSMVKGRRATVVMAPQQQVPVVPSRSKAKRAQHAPAPFDDVPASPLLQDRVGPLEAAPHAHVADADPSLSLPRVPLVTDPHAESDSREATLLQSRARVLLLPMVDVPDSAPSTAGAGQIARDDHARRARTSTPKRRKGQSRPADLATSADASSLSGTEGQVLLDILMSDADGSTLSESSAIMWLSSSHALPDSPLSDDGRATGHMTAKINVPAPSSTILVIRELARQRTDLLRAWQRLNNQVKAIERRGHPATGTLEVCAAPSIADSAAPALVQCVETTWAARKAVEKQLEKLAKALPVYETFTKPTKGLGAGGLALIIGETGDLSLYANPAKVWKRMGLAVFNGERQRRVAGNAEEAIRQGYSSHRRQIMWNIGDSMIKVGDTYRQVYLDRKAYELAKNPDAKPIVHHRRSQRYMEKRILRDLWRAWRDLHGVTQEAAATP